MRLITKCNESLERLYKFSTEILFLGEPISDSPIEALEQEIKFELPKDFKYIIKKHNGITLAGTEFYRLSTELRGSSLNMVYNFEHFEAENPMPKNFLPFSPDSRGNQYCLDLSKIKEDTCPVVFWQWDVEFASFEDVEICNDNFVDWINEVMIDWTLQI